MSNELAVPQLSTAQLISNARRALAEARTLPDFRAVMEAATVAADAGKRAAKLMEAQGMAAGVVRQASEAANDAAAVRIEAQAGAGRILRQMAENGERARRGYRPVVKSSVAEDHLAPTLPEMGIDHKNVTRWGQVADIPDEVRVEYVDTTKEGGGEITTAGLLRFAAKRDVVEDVEDDDPNGVQAELGRAYDNVTKAMEVLAHYRGAGAIAAYASASRRKTRFRELLGRARAWVEEAERTLE